MCVCVEVWRYERVQGMQRMEHARAQGLGSLRTSLTPQLPLAPAQGKITRKRQGIALQVSFSSIADFTSKRRYVEFVLSPHTSTFQGLVEVCVETS